MYRSIRAELAECHYGASGESFENLSCTGECGFVVEFDVIIYEEYKGAG
jgi:hypothetical protein